MFRNKPPTSSGARGDYPNPTSSRRQRIEDGLKILLDVAKESSDWFPPLKSALGGVSALIKHYEHSKDVKEKVEDLIPQLERFKRNITTTTIDGDPEETERRRGLASTFEKIEEISRTLLAKGAIARFVDKGADSGVVAKLVERLRQAIVSYQISQQQAIYRQITDLTSSFNTLLKFHEKPPVVREKLESVMARLNGLRGAPWQELQHERWARLFDDLGLIRDKARALHERIATEGYAEQEEDVLAVSGLAEDLRDVLLEYQMTQQQALYDQNCRLIDAVDLSVLNSCRRAQGAEYRHGNRRGCLKGTRETVLNEIESWAKDFNKSPVFWLNGLAGTGKSTIAQTIAKHLFAEECLGASFFCSRDFEDRSNLHFIFPTIAFQLAHKYPDFRSYFVSLLRSNPDVVHESLYSQMERLIVEPLQMMGTSTVVVIDAVDECKDDEPSSAVLSVLGRLVERIPRVKFFITSRPEPRIKTGFRLPLLEDATKVFVLHDVHPPLINSDIRLFLKHELSELAQRRQLVGWPSDEHINLLCRRAAGLFVYAVATIKFLDSSIHLPKRQLDVIVNLPECTIPEGRTHFRPNTTLDSLYTSILQTAFIEEDPTVDSHVRSTIGAVVLLVNPLPPSGIAELVGLDLEEVKLFLTLVQSLLALGEDLNQPVKPFHRSFPDFITDNSRCTNKRFYISPGHLHYELTISCLRAMNNGLGKNILLLPDYALNSEVRDLETRIDDHISIAMRYACQTWHNHLIQTRGDVTEVVSHLHIFLEEKFLAWLEVVSALGAVGGAVVALEKLMSWLQKVAKDEELLNTTRDCFQFVTKFFQVINISATHIYHSALELCPVSSIVRKLYSHQHVNCLPKVVIGTSDSWDQTISVSTKDYNYGHCIWSPCGQFVAAQAESVVEIRNQLTFELLTILHPTETALEFIGPLAYSPDGCSLACASETGIIIWDTQTGGVAKEIQCSAKYTSLVWSLDGGMIATTTVGDQDTFNVHIHEVASSKILFLGTLPSRNKPHLWAHDKSFCVMVTWLPKPYKPFGGSFEPDFGIEIFQVESRFTKIKSFSVNKPENRYPWQKRNGNVAFSPTTHRISISDDDILRIWDVYSSECLLKEACFYFHCFSPDGSLFAASKSHRVHIWIWKYTSGHYTLWRKFHCQGEPSSFQFSPTQLSVLGHSKNILQAWHLNNLPTTSKPYCQQYAGLSRSGTCIATAYRLGSTITITNLLSQTPSQVIDTDVEIEGLVITGNVLLVVGSKKIVAWWLTEEGVVGGIVGNRRADHNDSIWTILPTQSHPEYWTFKVDGQVGIINPDRNTLHFYHTETGEVLDPAQAPLHHSGRWSRFVEVLSGQHYLHHHNLSQCNIPLNDNWQTSKTTLQDGWVKDAEGKHRLWVPVEWRMFWNCADWRHDVTTQFSHLGLTPLIIRF